MQWDREQGSKRQFGVGLAWSGNPTNKNDKNRSIPLRALSPLLGIDALAAFSDTAAVIASLDLVITADTCIAHLAGALAKPVWVLLPFAPDWRRLLDRNNSPWYPGARLFRQNAARSRRTDAGTLMLGARKTTACLSS